MKITSILKPTDNHGNFLHAHGGAIVRDKGVWYWFGERPRYRGWFFGGIGCYSSRDLQDWTYEGLAYEPAPKGHLSHDTVAYRPKVLCNSTIGKYVLFLSECDGNCRDGHIDFAVSDTITGPYQLVNSCYGHGGRHTMDFTVFQDDDGQGYLFYSANTDGTGHWIDKLSADYLSIVSTVAHPSDYAREAPCVLKQDGRYYLYFSECTGWAPNQGWYVTAENLAGPWSRECKFGDATTYGSQGYCFFTIEGKAGPVHVYAGDVWDGRGIEGPGDPCDFDKCFYLWLPMRVEGETLAIDFVEQWEIDPV